MSHLALARAQIVNPNLTSSAFNTWYNNNLLPAFMQNHNASLGLRYQFAGYASSAAAPTWDYLALYHTHENATSLQSRVDNLRTRDIGPEDVRIEITTWDRLQTLESLHEREGNVSMARAPYLLLDMAEPKQGLEKVWDDWYRLQHMDMVSMLDGFRRGTRWRANESIPLSWLTLQEFDSVGNDPYLAKVLRSTEFARNATDGYRHEVPSWWKLIFETGDENL